MLVATPEYQHIYQNTSTHTRTPAHTQAYPSMPAHTLAHTSACQHTHQNTRTHQHTSTHHHVSTDIIMPAHTPAHRHTQQHTPWCQHTSTHTGTSQHPSTYTIMRAHTQHTYQLHKQILMEQFHRCKGRTPGEIFSLIMPDTQQITSSNASYWSQNWSLRQSCTKDTGIIVSW